MSRAKSRCCRRCWPTSACSRMSTAISDRQRRRRCADSRRTTTSSSTAAHYRGGLAEYARLARAQAIDALAATQAASWGLFQIMGMNHVAAGFADVDGFVAAMNRSEAAHLDAFCAFLVGTRSGTGSLRDLLAARNW